MRTEPTATRRGPGSAGEKAAGPKTIGRYSSVRKARLGPAVQCRHRFLWFFPHGFKDETYLNWERGYKAEAHTQWDAELRRSQFRALLKAKRFEEITAKAIRIESRTNLWFSFEKTALRDATRTAAAAHAMAEGLYNFPYGSASAEARFAQRCDVVGALPRRQTRVLTWPVVTVFGFIAQPKHHMFLKPNVTRVAAARYGFDFGYRPRPNWSTYSELLDSSRQYAGTSATSPRVT